MTRDELIKILLDSNSFEEDRHDAAGYLSDFPDEVSLSALCKAALNENNKSTEIDSVKAKSGESIGNIMVKQDKLEKKFLVGLSREAKAEVLGVFKVNKPEWYKQLMNNKS